MRHGAEIEDLLAEMAWVRRLARGLVHDAASADDLAQDALVLSIGRRDVAPRTPGALRAWLATLVRRLAIDRRRSETRRASREAERARSDVDTPLDVVERSERQQRFVRAVHALAEPYRSTVLLRYLDELSTAEVARRTAADEALVRKRLSRALALLRADIERTDGTDVHAWLAPLIVAPPIGYGPASAAAKIGGLTMASKWIVASTAAVLVLAASLYFVLEEKDAGATELASTSVAPAELAVEPKLARTELEPAPPAIVPRVEEHVAVAPKSADAVASMPSTSADLAPTAADRYEGFVLVDGMPRIPPGFRVEGSTLEVRTDERTGRYVAEAKRRPPEVPRVQQSSIWWITSDESAPLQLELPRPEGAQRRDIELASGTTLDLRVVEVPGERPVIGREFLLRASVVTSRTASASMNRMHDRVVVTGADGHVRCGGLTRDGSVTLTMSRHPSDAARMGTGSTDTLWRSRITPTGPRALTGTVYLAPDEAPLVLRGTIAPRVDLKAHVVAQSVDDQGKTIESGVLAKREGDRFEVVVLPRTTWRVWLEDDTTRISVVRTVVVADRDPDPVDLTPREMKDVLVRVVNAPKGGRVRLGEIDQTPRRSQTIEIEAGHGEAHVRLDEPMTIRVACEEGPEGSGAGSMTIVRIDPARESSYEIDLHGDAHVDVEFAVSGLSSVEPCPITLQRTDDSGESAKVWIDRGRSMAPARLTPGRWIWWYRGSVPSLAGGAIDVAPGTNTIRIACTMQRHTQGELASGIELLAFEGGDTPLVLDGRPMRLTWLQLVNERDVDEVWLGDGLRWRPLPAK